MIKQVYTSFCFIFNSALVLGIDKVIFTLYKYYADLLF